MTQLVYVTQTCSDCGRVVEVARTSEQVAAQTPIYGSCLNCEIIWITRRHRDKS